MLKTTVRNFCFLFVFTIATQIYCIHLPMQRIDHWQDVIRFAGKVVAYTTVSNNLGSGQGFVLEDPNLKFGYVGLLRLLWDEGEGYNLNMILKPNDVIPHNPLINSKLDEADVHMREATQDEIVAIAVAVDRKEASLGKVSKRTALSLIIRNLH